MKLARRRCLLALSAIPAVGMRPALAAPVRRTVSVGGAVTEIVHALGAGDTLVGADSTSTYPPSAARLPRVGYMRQLSAEGVLALRPELVLATAEAGPPAVFAQLETAGVKVLRLAVRHTPEALRDNIRRIAEALQQPEAGLRVLADLDVRWARTRARIGAMRTHPRVLFLLAHGGGPPMVAGSDTAADAMITLAGGVNAARAMAGYKPLTAEAAIAAAPEVLLITDQGLEESGGLARLASHPGLALTPAGRARRVVAMDALYLLGFGPRLPEAVAELSERIARP